MIHLRLNTLTYLVLPLALGACPIPKSLGDNPDDGTTAGDADTTGDIKTTTSADSGDLPGTSTGDPQTSTAESGDVPGTSTDYTTTTADGPMCQNPAQMCGLVPLDCSEHNCGGLGSPFDADGCLRQACDGDNPCGEDEVCFGDELAGCSPSVVGCSIEDGACECFSSDDCGGRYCHPKGTAPPTDCGALTDEPSCLDAGCTTFEPAQRVKFVDGACVCDGPVAECLWFPDEEFGGAASPGAFYHAASQEVVVFGTIWTPPPYAWVSCNEPGAPPACACALDCE